MLTMYLTIVFVSIYIFLLSVPVLLDGCHALPAKYRTILNVDFARFHAVSVRCGSPPHSS